MGAVILAVECKDYEHLWQIKTKNVLICVRAGEHSRVCLGLEKLKHKEKRKHVGFKIFNSSVPVYKLAFDSVTQSVISLVYCPAVSLRRMNL